jgi:ElaB/YqjD/DUF883 family membrane-anchored ribosome-binding protein
VEQPTPDVKSTSELEHDMQQTRESITEKVAALESQVLGTFQNAADTVTNTVDAVKEAVTSAPAAMSETVRQTVDAVKQSFHDTIGSFSLGGCVEKNPWASLGVSAFAGFLLGYRTASPSGPSNFAGQHFVSAPAPSSPPSQSAPQPHGFLGDLGGMLGKELRQLAEDSLVGAIQKLKQSIGTHMPEVVDSAVNRVSEQLQSASRGRSKASVNGY